MTPITDLDGANRTLAAIASVERQIRDIELNLNARIDAAKAEAGRLAAPLTAELKTLEAALRAYSEYHKPTLFASRRSIELLYGSFGFRQSTELKTKPKTTWAMVLEAIRGLGRDSAIRRTESCNREAMEAWTDQELDEVGVTRTLQDRFWYEAKREEVKA